MVKIAIIGGTGLERPDLLQERQEKSVSTPYGPPSDALITGKISGIEVVILARHGRKHNINPSNVNYRANLYAFKQEGCTHLIVTTACGSLQENIRPGDFVTPDQFIDRTSKRIQTLYDGEKGHLKGVCHVPMADPFSAELQSLIAATSEELGYTCHPKGTVVCIEGPRFSTKAESLLFKSWNSQLVNMTLVPEVVLAAELALPYGALAIATDYDCWRESDEGVNVGAVIETLKTAADRACRILKNVIPKVAARDWTETYKKLGDTVNLAVMHGETQSQSGDE